MEWTNIISAVLAGGIAGQLVTLLWGNRLSEKREYRKWLLVERYSVYSQLIDMLVNTPENEQELDRWTYKIRTISHKIYILFENGSLPKEFSEALESVFQLAKQKKDGMCDENWQIDKRNTVGHLKKLMSSNLKP
jgi:hypothetical protein